MLAFDALVLSDAIGRNIRLGKIVHGDRSATLNVKSSSLISEARMRIKSCAALVANTSPPDLVLNRHCGQCEFQLRCYKQAREKDDLSLLHSSKSRDIAYQCARAANGHAAAPPSRMMKSRRATRIAV
jgi:hypothetical protein